MRSTQYNCCRALEFLSPGLCPQQRKAEGHRVRDLGSHRSAWIATQQDWRNQAAMPQQRRAEAIELWQSRVKRCDFRVSVFFQVVQIAEALVRWFGKVKHLFVSYF